MHVSGGRAGLPVRTTRSQEMHWSMRISGLRFARRIQGILNQFDRFVKVFQLPGDLPHCDGALLGQQHLPGQGSRGYLMPQSALAHFFSEVGNQLRLPALTHGLNVILHFAVVCRGL